MNILIFADSLEHLSFFQRLSRAYSESNCRNAYFTNRYSVWKECQKSGLECWLLQEAAREQLLDDLDIFWEVQCGLLDKRQASLTIGALEKFFELKQERFCPDCVFVWNGSQLVGRKISMIAKQMGFNTLFFEIGNFPGKMIVDPEGVNIRSYYADNYKNIRSQHVNMENFRNWRADYLRKKIQQHSVPQARNVRHFNVRYLEDLYGFRFHKAPLTEKPEVLRRTLNYFLSRSIDFEFDHFNPEQERYLFFPLQVSTDSQLLWNSDVDNIQALSIAAEIATSENLKLVVKPHPAESDRVFVKKLLSSKIKLGFLFVNENTFQLIKHCQKVITINSTVGLEAKLMERPVEVLGSAIYSNFSEEDIARYLMNYLIDIEYFSDEPISQEAAQRILSRAQSGACIDIGLQ